MKKIVLVAAVLAIVISAVAVWSQSGRRGGPGGMMASMAACPQSAVITPQAGMIDHMSKTLKLTKTQTAKLKKIAADGDKTLRPLRSSAAKSSNALRSAMLASKYNSKNVKIIAAKAEKAEAKIVTASIDTWTRMRLVLTASQSAKLQKAMKMDQPPQGQGPAGPPPGMNR
ncbi:MAG: periplasmic heavy metal sensor [Armatimonadota bacterium]